MKKIFSALLLAAASLAVFTACGDPIPDPVPEPIVASLSVSPSSLQFGWEGGQAEVEIKASHNWSISTSGGTGLSCNPKSGTGDAVVTVTCEPAAEYGKPATFIIKVTCEDKTATIEAKREEKPGVSSAFLYYMDGNGNVKEARGYVSSEGGEHYVNVLTNTEIDLEFVDCGDWVKSYDEYIEHIHQKTKLDVKNARMYILPNATGETRHGKIIVRNKPASDVSETIEFEQPSSKVREAVLEFGKSMGFIDAGLWDEWEPTEYWSGVDIVGGKVVSLYSYLSGIKGQIPDIMDRFPDLEKFNFMTEPGITGPIPESFGALKKLKLINLAGLDLTGTIPDVFGEMKDLESITIMGNENLGGDLPASLGECPKLSIINFRMNGFTGTIPESWCAVDKDILLFGNKLSGQLPEAFYKMPSAVKNFEQCVEQQDGYMIDVSNAAKLKGYIDESERKTLYGENFYVQDVIASSDYTMLMYWRTDSQFAEETIPSIKAFYDSHSSKGFSIVGITPSNSDPVAESFVRLNGCADWYNVSCDTLGEFVYIDYPHIEIYDKDGFILYSTRKLSDPKYGRFNRNPEEDLISFLESLFK